MRPIVWFLLGLIAAPFVLGLAGLLCVKTIAHGFSTRTQPISVEKFAATQARLLAISSNAKSLTNPVPHSKEALAEERAHWADHCATRHVNNGSGQTEMGQLHLAPRSRKRIP
jgi:hypothetical protein